ncbi:hypothetical protein CR513_12297, partial [Mucuna pruriens]
MSVTEWKKYTWSVMVVQERLSHWQDPLITFTDKDYEGMVPHLDDPMTLLEESPGTLIGFLGEQVGIRGTINLEPTFGAGLATKRMKLRLMLGDATKKALESWKADLGGATRLRSRRESLELDPRLGRDDTRPQPGEDLKEVQIGSEAHHKTKIKGSLDSGVEEQLVRVLRENEGVFAWSLEDMSSIDPDFLCHRLSITLETQPVSQKKRRLGEEKRRVAKKETTKLLQARFIREVKYPI